MVQPGGNPEACQQAGDQRKAAWISGGQALRPDPRREGHEQDRNLPDEHVERMTPQKRHGAEGEDAWKPGDQKPDRRDRTDKIYDAVCLCANSLRASAKCCFPIEQPAISGDVTRSKP